VTDESPGQAPESIPRQIRSRVLNQTMGQWIRAVDLVLSEYEPTGLPVAMEAERVAKLTVFTMLRRWFDDDAICLLSDSSDMQLPKKLCESSSHDIAAIIDRPPSGVGMIDDHEPEDPDAPPGRHGFSPPLRPPTEERSP
jgi:hypothetical protein